ncbi:conserved Plasmodium protein, unknown function [Plasmodium berghei]|uniref:HTH cro/C1-type domain-containing protein n=2 Tax=Plasmodium berghei TaxID=5821 RepID=A0A509AKM8_PLABA|nr:conserved protein, unknown function [Plasmodium berghei ANKA]CXI02147.1 conserved Plasmodium protein, unknown function [Plasmodium berghei]SCL91929.1 conserved Plasmodium protein, unknown function [Plasmodium berghei]SCM15559.1 conserved Plasmodium protein, unknown function [Plasmodium berghei]SCM17351.1 conserved Plasmodium protein, unknown function [Plasmodium berghei]SCN22582.1 conserved Plasmodium protein, unknown function [Plasmodium berghei]|eukprot:XP_034420157.1 conserved protein, unknown function [Plasmodium berghei ANKA]
MGKSFYNRSTRLWWGHYHLRIGSRLQVKLNKGIKFSNFQHIGRFIEFSRNSKSLRAATLSKCLRRNFWGTNFYYTGKPKTDQNSQQIMNNSQDEGGYIYAVEKGKITPSDIELKKLEKVLGVPLKRQKQKTLLRKL